MCGLIGVAGDLNFRGKKAFDDGLYMSALRGVHSTGIASMDHDGDIDIFKMPVTAELFQSHRYYDKLVNLNSYALIGHNRHATRGAIKRENCHPFGFDNIVGAHNGTLDYEALRSLEGYSKFDTDSEALYNHMDTHGVKETVSLLSGAWALTWIDSRDRTINFLRNDQRPLFLAMSDCRNMLFWMSEEKMLEAILERNEIKHMGIFELPENMWYRWIIPNRTQIFQQKPTAHRCEGKKPVPFVAGTHDAHNVVRWWTPQGGGGTDPESLVVRSAKDLRPKSSNESGSKKSDAKPDSTQKELMKKAGLPTAVITDKENSGSDPFESFYIEGYHAGRGLEPKSSNPYGKTNKGRAWEDGRKAGLEHVNKDSGSVDIRLKEVEEALKTQNHVDSVVDEAIKQAFGGDEVPWEESKTIIGFRGERLSELQYRTATKSCCGWCGNPVDPGDEKTWTKRDEFICTPCVNSEVEAAIYAMKAV